MKLIALLVGGLLGSASASLWSQELSVTYRFKQQLAPSSQLAALEQTLPKEIWERQERILKNKYDLHILNYCNSKSVYTFDRAIFPPEEKVQILENVSITFYKDFLNRTTYKKSTGDSSAGYGNITFELDEFNRWTILHDSTLNVLGFTCIKAILPKNDKLVEAWFCPDLPISDGPDKYRGLPGLILKVISNQRDEWEAQSIENKSVCKDMVWPTITSTVDFQTYDKQSSGSIKRR